jgi:disulfide bond formation protein DsbB
MPAPLSPSDRLAAQLALATPLLLLAGAYISQYGFGLFPCEMCWWQRYPHFAAAGFALLAMIAPPRRLWIAIAAGGIVTSGLIGGFHAGIEYGWWQGITGCTGTDPFSFEIVRCDQAAWTLAGISLAGFNALFSIGAGVAIWVLLLAKEKAR